MTSRIDLVSYDTAQEYSVTEIQEDNTFIVYCRTVCRESRLVPALPASSFYLRITSTAADGSTITCSTQLSPEATLSNP